MNDRRKPREYRRRGTRFRLCFGRIWYAGRELVLRLVADNENSSLHCIAKAGDVSSECERRGQFQQCDFAERLALAGSNLALQKLFVGKCRRLVLVAQRNNRSKRVIFG